METSTLTQDITIVGPNLPDQRLGQFHVHRKGCRDLARPSLYPRGLASDFEDVESRDECIEIIYADMIADGDDVADYRDEFHFAPCVTLR